tara:strand:- start:310 stop:474 length:165 start_codon:yes stop_codon:yes gene_type:complete
MKLLLPKKQSQEREEKEAKRKREYREKILQGPEWWWDAWEYHDYRRFKKEEKNK